MDKKEKLKLLQKLSEEDLTRKFLIPLYESEGMGYKNVRYTHKRGLEFGKDMICYKDDEYGNRVFTGIQVKRTRIRTSDVARIVHQIREAFGEPFTDNDGKKQSLDRFVVLTSNEFLQEAKESICADIRTDRLDKLVTFVDGNRVVALLDKHLPSAFWDEYDYFDKYFNAMKEDFETIRDVTAIGQKEPIPLENIYVSLKLTEKVREREIPIEKGRKVSEKERKIFEEKLLEKEEAKRRGERERTIDTDRAVKDYDKLVIVGAPGSGKTTLLKYLALKTCKQNLEKQERTCVPIPITLREFAENGKGLRAYVDEVFERYQFPKAKEFVEKDLKDGKCQLLLDGFDELATKDRQEKVSEEIREFIGTYPKCRTVVTSRIAGYHDELKGFTKLELMEFDDKQMKLFIDNWFGKTSPEKAASMYRAIKENERIKALAHNPLMIAIIAVIYEEDRELPQRRADLYKRCVEVLLSRWDVQKRLKNNYPSDKKEFILRKLGFYGHSNNKRVMSEKEIKEEMLKYFPQIGLDKDDPKPFLDEIWQRSYLLRQISMESYDFLHLSFQEYFTALELIARQDGIAIIIQHLLESWWEEPILLYSGISKDATALIKSIQKEVPEDIFYSNLMLFGKCIADAEFTEPSLRKEIVNDLWSLYKTAELSPLRYKAMEIIALIKPDSIIDSLIKELKSRQSSVRRRAAEALGEVESERAIEPLIKALSGEKENEVRKSVAKALGDIGSEEAVESLIKGLATDEATYVRWSVVEALGEIGGDKAIDPVLGALSDKNAAIRWSAGHALGRIGSEKAFKHLVKALAYGKDNVVKEVTADVLGWIENEKAIEPLIRILTTEKASSVRWRATYSLGRRGSKKAVSALIRALTSDEDIFVRTGAATALGWIRSEKAVQPLIKVLTSDKDHHFRWRAAEALGTIASEKAIDPLTNILATAKKSEDRWRAAYVLGRMGIGKATELLIKALSVSKQSDVRRGAAEALGAMGSDKAIGPLIKALSADVEIDVRWMAAEALGMVGSEKEIKALKGALSDEGEWLGDKVKDAAFEALEKISRRTKKRILKEPD